MAEVVTKVITIYLFLCLFTNKCEARSVARDEVYENDLKLEKLLLTPYLKENKTEDAKVLARVHNLSSNTDEVESYSGFLTVDSNCESNLFFWFFPAAYNREEAPLIISHGGGPGSSGLLSLFVGTGPFYVDDEGVLHQRAVPWTLSRSVLYVDSPVGTGFSEHADRPECYVKTDSTAAKHMYEALTQFYQLFAEFRKNPLYIFTGSYGGKFGPAIAYEIHTQNKNHLSNLDGHEEINLKGISLTSGFTDPISQIDYGDFYHSMGLIDNKQIDYFRQQESEAKVNIRQGHWGAAYDIIEPLILGLVGVQSYLKNITGLAFPYNMLMNHSELPKYMKNHVPFVNTQEIRKALHVGNSKNFSNSNPKLYNNFRDDIYQSAKPLVEELLESGKYRFHIASGQLDLVVPHTTVANFVQNINWKDANEFRDAETTQWITETGLIGGYVKSHGNLTYLLYRNCGHIWYKDQPEWAHEVMKSFTKLV